MQTAATLPPWITPTLPTATAGAPAAAAPVPPAATAEEVGAVRHGVATAIRSVGAGIDAGSHQVGLVSDKSWIYPIEGLGQAGKAVKQVTDGKPVVGKVGGIVGTGLPFAAGFYGMLFSGMLQAPGTVAKDLANGLADRVDGQKTQESTFGFDVPAG
jgi:hypothetical protein